MEYGTNLGYEGGPRQELSGFCLLNVIVMSSVLSSCSSPPWTPSSNVISRGTWAKNHKCNSNSIWMLEATHMGNVCSRQRKFRRTTEASQRGGSTTLHQAKALVWGQAREESTSPLPAVGARITTKEWCRRGAGRRGTAASTGEECRNGRGDTCCSAPFTALEQRPYLSVATQGYSGELLNSMKSEILQTEKTTQNSVDLAQFQSKQFSIHSHKGRGERQGALMSVTKGWLQDRSLKKFSDGWQWLRRIPFCRCFGGGQELWQRRLAWFKQRRLLPWGFHSHFQEAQATGSD